MLDSGSESDSFYSENGDGESYDEVITGEVCKECFEEVSLH